MRMYELQYSENKKYLELLDICHNLKEQYPCFKTERDHTNNKNKCIYRCIYVCAYCVHDTHVTDYHIHNFSLCLNVL